jgi:type II restriction enzyme
MTVDDLLVIYEEKKNIYAEQTYRQISNILAEAKVIHEKDFQGDDHEQSWRAFKGKNLERLIEYIIKDQIEALGLKIINGASLERTEVAKLSKNLGLVKRNLLVDYGEFGMYLPDVDMVIYEPDTSKVLAVLSSKVTLRERITQTGYWKFKLYADEATKHIQVYFITPDEDGTLLKKYPSKKGRAIVETDIDGSYVLSEAQIEESDKVKMFDKFIGDLKSLIGKEK